MFCANCLSTIPSNETVYYSGVFGATKQCTLCHSCHQSEEIAIQNNNDQPQLLNLYFQNIHQQRETRNYFRNLQNQMGYETDD